jgi:hypothetical protein
MGLLRELPTYARFAVGLRRFLGRRLTLEEARRIVRERLARREENFLGLVGKGIYGNPRSPYLPLLRLAGVEQGDFHTMVRRHGVEGTLHLLRQAGVSVTFEEFRGHQPLVRGGRTFAIRPRDFDNPYLKRYYQGQTGGSTGAGVRVSTDLDHLAAEAPNYMLTDEAHGILYVPTATWLGVLPDSSGTNFALRHAHYGHVVAKWFSHMPASAMRVPLRHALSTRMVLWMARLHGLRLPAPEPAPLDQAIRVARWASDTLRAQGRCLVVSTVSRALRVALAAEEAGWDLKGAAFIGTGEPATRAKVAGITRTGARWIPAYAFSEAGIAGFGCPEAADPSDVHLFTDLLALIQHPRQIGETALTVDTFYFTSLCPTAPKLLLNVEIDDYGMVETRSCGCGLGAAGLTTHVRQIYSYRKLTGEGVTLVGSDAVRILEEVLPAHFGGSPLDYQLVEEEDSQGFTRLFLYISPEIRLPSEAAAIEVVLRALERGSFPTGLAGAIWGQAGSLRVKRAPPLWTARGKHLPLRLKPSSGEQPSSTCPPARSETPSGL